MSSKAKQNVGLEEMYLMIKLEQLARNPGIDAGAIEEANWIIASGNSDEAFRQMCWKQVEIHSLSCSEQARAGHSSPMLLQEEYDEPGMPTKLEMRVI